MLVHALLAAVMVATATFAFAAEPSKADSAEAIVNGLSIDTGFVIIKGEYLPSPYTVGRRGDDLFVNGHPINTEGLRIRRWGGGGGGYYRSMTPEPSRGSAAASNQGVNSVPDPNLEPRTPPQWYFNYVAHVERQLQDNSLLIVFDDKLATFLPGGSETPVLEALLADKPRDEKIKTLMKLHTRDVESARWAALVDSFRSAPDLAARVEKLKKEREALYRRPVPSRPSLSKYLMYGITVMGIVLGVVALGSLLNHRPHSNASWNEIDTSGDSIPHVVRNVALVATLSFFDLICTLLANGSMGFSEMNPLGSALLANPILLACFKITSLAIGCGILLALRRYRGAQVASWWLCLVCTILAFRWATYSSLLLA
ncbi:MAG TPA: DUF5658 family protein [Thermoguttaceae bacterium]|nr:DUF5658 family protein [Thermoguttaceae bacterium]